MTDQILIRQLRVEAIIGIHDWEKANKQPLLIDLDLAYDCRPAAASDDIKDALDYFAVCECITEFISNSQFELIETLAEHIIALIFDQFPTDHIRLKLLKPDAIKNAQTVGLSIQRSRT